MAPAHRALPHAAQEPREPILVVGAIADRNVAALSASQTVFGRHRAWPVVVLFTSCLQAQNSTILPLPKARDLASFIGSFFLTPSNSVRPSQHDWVQDDRYSSINPASANCADDAAASHITRFGPGRRL